jgi:hypothetical protein
LHRQQQYIQRGTALLLLLLLCLAAQAQKNEPVKPSRERPVWGALRADRSATGTQTGSFDGHQEIRLRLAGLNQKSEQSKKLLVVTPESFQAALRDYVAYKKKQMPTEMVTLESVLKTSQGVDDPEKLKRYLFKAWKERNVGYVLLVGDADVLPVRFMALDRVTPAAFDYAFYPSDLYYSDLAHEDGTFDDWNGQHSEFHNGFFGEVRGEKNKQDPINYDHITYHPKVAVGRWPVNTPEEVQIVANKTMRYEEGVVRGDKPGMKRAALFSVGGWVDSRGLMDGLANTLSGGWSVEKRYYADRRRNDNTPPPDETQLDSLLNEGLGLLIHAGHGSDDTWFGCCSVAHLPRVHNADRLPILISAGCSTARFCTLPPYEPYLDIYGKEHAGTDHGEIFTAPPPPPAVYQKGKYNPTGLGEQLLRRGPDGAVAYIGCNTGSQPCALTLEEGFIRAIANAKQPRLGDCWSQAIVYYFDHEHLATIVPNEDWYPASIFFQGMKYMVYGDPSLRLPSSNR